MYPGIADDTEVDIYQPFNNYSNTINITSTVKAKNGKILIGLKEVKPGVVKLESTVFKYKIFVEPGDEITLTVDKGGHYSFSGNNADGQYYINKMKPAGKSADEDFDSSILLAPTVSALWDSTVLCMEKYKAIYDKLQADSRITPAMNQYFLSYVEAFMLMYTYMRFNTHLNGKDGTNRLHTTLSDAEIISYLKKLYTVFDPLASKYRSSAIWSIIVGNKFRLIKNEHQSPENSPEFLKWRNFEQGEQIFAIAPDSIQEVEMARTVLFLIGYGQATKRELAENIQWFNNYYPQSKWNKFIDQQFEMVPNIVSKQNTLDKPQYYINYDESHGGVQMMIRENLQDVNNLQDLVKALSPGTPLLVDCWATWCSPCIAELRHSQELHQFLNNAHVNILYLSFDAPTNRNILTTIQKYKLNGMHYVASDMIAESVARLYGTHTLQIPRFLLFDSQGNLLEANLNLPSSGDKLYEQIKNKLKNKSLQ